MRYDVAIVSCTQGDTDQSGAGKLHAALSAFVDQGWQICYVLPNGLNRWTVIASQDSAPAVTPAVNPRAIEVIQRYHPIVDATNAVAYDKVVWRHDGIAGHAPIVSQKVEDPNLNTGLRRITVGGISTHVDDFSDLLTTLGLSLADVQRQIEQGHV